MAQKLTKSLILLPYPDSLIVGERRRSWCARIHLHTRTSPCLYSLALDSLWRPQPDSLFLSVGLSLQSVLEQGHSTGETSRVSLHLPMKGQMGCKYFYLNNKWLTDPSRLAGEELLGPIMSERREMVFHPDWKQNEWHEISENLPIPGMGLFSGYMPCGSDGGRGPEGRTMRE